MTTGPSRRHGRRNAAVRLIVSGVFQAVLIVLGVAFIFSAGHSPSFPLLVAWCIIGTVYALGIWVALRIASGSAESDEPPTVLELSIVARTISRGATILVSFVGITAAVQHILLDPQGELDILTNGVGIWAMILAWILLHWGFAQLYLQLYYREATPPLKFPSSRSPGVLEFAYFSFTLAVSYAVSDVEVLDRRMRWQVMTHSVLGFFFNGAIIVTALGSLSEVAAGL
ncbi:MULTISPECIES: DUF1345 domain-containing protein [unclassified Microbacterium]|uniref:DUF1345 domain-containing protein n=1 Tax=unclassified Microbacterium TaxID=2609290 RepID=UPI003745D461